MRIIAVVSILSTLLFSCTKQDLTNAEITEKSTRFSQESSHFQEIGMVDIGTAGAAEISAYDEVTKKLFVVNNAGGLNRIEVVDLSMPSAPKVIGNINIAKYGGFINSVAVNNGKLAAAIEASNKQQNGKVVIFSTDNYAEIAVVAVGALPDMVCFSPDGKFILTADEGEPSNDYKVDPIGTVSIISVDEGYTVRKLDFAKFASRADELKEKGLRIYGPGASFAQDIEPEYVAVAANSKKAWVSLQENNAIARIDLNKMEIEELLPLGFKNYNEPFNSIDPSDQDGGFFFNPWPVYGIYEPDALAVIPVNNVPFIYSANEGDARDYSGFAEMARVSSSSIKLDPTAFPDGVTLKQNSKLGRLNVTKALGDTDGDGDYDKLYSIGGRSFSIWNGLTGQQVFDSKDDLDRRCVELGIYPDNRSDDKGSEPEGVVIGRVGNRNLLFVGLERTDAVFIYDVTNPVQPVYLQHLLTGDAPEGIHFVSAEKSPTGRSLLIVSSEDDGVVKVYSSL
jgi:hypothetical protein